jgi:hypothetical protein
VSRRLNRFLTNCHLELVDLEHSCARGTEVVVRYHSDLEASHSCMDLVNGVTDSDLPPLKGLGFLVQASVSILNLAALLTCFPAASVTGLGFLNRASVSILDLAALKGHLIVD